MAKDERLKEFPLCKYYKGVESFNVCSGNEPYSCRRARSEGLCHVGKNKKKRKTGTREWAEHNRNIESGCENDCRYCYAREMAVRFKRHTNESWSEPIFLEDKFNEKARKLKGRIMFPTTHDITEGNIDHVVQYLKAWLEVGNEILIVSKPQLSCIKVLCEDLAEYKSQITFRFTIGSTSNETLAFWEPNAPTFEERLAALKWAFECGYRTSVSAEPYLGDTINILVETVQPYVTDVIWIGKMNQVKKRVNLPDTEEARWYMKVIEDISTDSYVRNLYNIFKDNPKVKWKDSIKKVIGLKEEEIG